MQSNLKNIFSEVKNDLDEEKIVLFSGTPCQIEGLYKFLKRKYPLLYTIDIICHGITSRTVWREYLDYLSNEGKYDISGMNFRDKETGWHRFSFSYYQNKKKKTSLFIDDPFCFFFDKHLILNESCFNCKFSTEPHLADITLGDFWGVSNFPEVKDDNKGVSLVIIGTEQGERLLKMSENLHLKKVNLDKALKYNLHCSPEKPNEYELFWKMFKEKGIKSCIDSFFYISVKHRIKIVIKRFMIKANMIKYFIK